MNPVRSVPPERLGFRLGVTPLLSEVAGLTERDWCTCPDGLLGTAAVPLITAGGTSNHDYAIAGPLRPTPALARSSALTRALAALGVPLGRARLVRLDAGAEAKFGGEPHYHWFRRAPACVALVTSPEVELQCASARVTFGAGEPWLLHATQPLCLRNRSARACVHLVFEARDPRRASGTSASPLELELHRFEVLDPVEFGTLCREILTDPEKRPMSVARAESFTHALVRLQERWNVSFERHGHDASGELAYRDLILDFREQILPKLVPGSGAMRAARVIDTMLEVSPAVIAPPLGAAARALRRTRRGPARGVPRVPEYRRPLFIVSAPRSGSTLLFDLLARLPESWTLGGENHELIRSIPELNGAGRGYASDRLTAADARPEIIVRLRERFAERIVDRDGRRMSDLPGPDRHGELRLIEKTPSNALRIPFLRAVFPDACFVYLRRDPRETISSMVEGWRSRRFLSYRGLPGWPHRDWSFLLPLGWRNLAGRSLVEIAAYQWQAASATIQSDLERLPPDDWCALDYEELVARPAQALRRIVAFARLRWDEAFARALSEALPLTHVTLSPPAPDKWRRHEAEFAAVLPTLARVGGLGSR